MKGIFYLIFFIIVNFFVVLTYYVNAQTVTSSPSAKIEERQINELKEKIASKVAEIQKENYKGVSGFIKKINKDSVIIEDNLNDRFEIKTDDVVTKYYRIENNTRKEINRDELKTDQFIFATGIINANQVEANNIYIDEVFYMNSGQIIEVNKDEYSLKVQLLEKKIITIDIENYTKQQMLNIKTIKAETIGFSKMKEGDTIHFVAKITDPAKTDRYSALKTLLIPQEFFIKK
jgi:uncharacterized protein YkvS